MRASLLLVLFLFASSGAAQHGAVAASPVLPILYCGAPPSFGNATYAGHTLMQVQVVTRHGDRTPLHGILWQQRIDDSLSWNCSLNLLIGDVVAGLQLRKRYIHGREILKGNCMLGQLSARGAQQHEV